MGITLAVFSIQGKTPEEKELLNISDSWLEMSFLSNFNTLVGILSGSTDVLEFIKKLPIFLPIFTCSKW